MTYQEMLSAARGVCLMAELTAAGEVTPTVDGRAWLEDYAAFWFTPEAQPRKYSFWAADAVYAWCMTVGDFSLAEELFEALKGNYAAWEEEKGMENGLFYQLDKRDGMEYSAGGSGCRPTINSYMYGDAVALSRIEKLCGRDVYFDTAFSCGRIPLLLGAEIVKMHGADKVLLGSDSPWASQGDEIRFVSLMDLNDEEKEGIYHKNAERLMASAGI